jgi:hypothetical protein
MAVSWDVSPYSVVDTDRRPDDGSCKILWIVGQHLPDNTVKYPTLSLILSSTAHTKRTFISTEPVNILTPSTVMFQVIHTDSKAGDQLAK